jgi:hypothetical protein
MSSEKNLKSEYRPSLWVFFLFNIVLLLLLFSANIFISPKLSLDIITSLRGAGIVVAYILVFVINGQLSSHIKAQIVFWRYKNPLPGCRAFSHHGLNDPRVNMDNLKTLHGTLPTSPREQNQLWYKIYSSHLSNAIVEKSHLDFLLARDLTSMSFLFLVFAGIPSLFISGWPWNVMYFGSLVLVYLLMSNLARNHGKRFVANVLALESVK